MPDGGVSVIATVVVDFFEAYGTAIAAAAAVASVVEARIQQQRQIDAYNKSLTDRYVMQRASNMARNMVLGRVRVSGTMAFCKSYNTDNATIAIVLPLAAHECDAIEKVYADQDELLLDASGNVVGVLRSENFSINSTTLTVKLGDDARSNPITAVATYSDGAVTLGTSLDGDHRTLHLSGARASEAGQVLVTYQRTSDPYTKDTQRSTVAYAQVLTATSGTLAFGGAGMDKVFGVDGTGPVDPTSISVSMQVFNGRQTALPYTINYGSDGAPASVSFTGATVGNTITLTYQRITGQARIRVRKYLGGPGQSADGTLISKLPGIWTTNHVGNSVCYLVVEMDYSQDAFSGGLPNISAVVRGLKCYDPRTGTTAWTDNPALLARAYFTHPLGANRPASEVNDTDVIAAANVCDTSTTFNLNGWNVTRPRYRAGMQTAPGSKPQDVLTDLCQAMGGRWVIVGGKLKVKAGGFTSPVATLDESWLTDQSSVQVQPGVARADVFNAAQGQFADEDNTFRAGPYPQVVAAPLVSSDGRKLEQDISYNAVTNIAQVQYLTACAIRYARSGATITLACNLRALPLEPFDVINVNLGRFGFLNQTFEVQATSWTPEGLIVLSLKYVDPSIWALDSSYNLAAYAPRTYLPNPWDLDPPVIGELLSGAAQAQTLADGTIVPRVYVPLTVTDTSVLSGGYVDMAYIDITDTGGVWKTETVTGDTPGVYTGPVIEGHNYLFKVRSRNGVQVSAWSTPVGGIVVGDTTPPVDLTQFALNVTPGAAVFTWDASPDLGDETELHMESVWNNATTPLYRGVATGYAMLWPADGSYMVIAKRRKAGQSTYSSGARAVSFTVSNGVVSGVTALWQTSADGPATWHSSDGSGGTWTSSGGNILIQTGNIVSTATTDVVTATGPGGLLRSSDISLSDPSTNKVGGMPTIVYQNPCSHDIKVEITASLPVSWWITDSSSMPFSPAMYINATSPTPGYSPSLSYTPVSYIDSPPAVGKTLYANQVLTGRLTLPAGAIISLELVGALNLFALDSGDIYGTASFSASTFSMTAIKK